MTTTKHFMDDDFLLETNTARTLFHQGAKDAPIYDYHCHLVPKEIAENKRLSTLTEAWLGGDHYKWRMMRARGFDEALITGGAEPYEKFLAWAATVENLIGNPLYHWTHLELQRYFGIREPLTVKTAPAVWEKANAALATDALSVKGIFARFNVHTIGTTDDPADTLEYHRAIAGGTAPIGRIPTRIFPAFRPDSALAIDQPGFAAYLDTLGKAAGVTIATVDDLLTALEKRLDVFMAHGCRAADHGLERPPFVLYPEKELTRVFNDALAGRTIFHGAADAFRTTVLTALAHMYAVRGLAMEVHLSVIRSVSAVSRQRLGPNTGFDAATDGPVSVALAGLLSHIEETGPVPRMIFFTLNPKDYYPLLTVMGGFQDNREGGVCGKMQLGSAWWFLDHRDGMEEQMRLFANGGLLSSFIGMLTDSRSFLSYPRHEYFRRILCNLLGRWVENGEYPADMPRLTEIVRGISFGNAEAYFG